MTIHLYNTLTREKEAFAPIDAKNVRMYVCGPTVYDYAHIGNARPVVVFDTLFRLLRHAYGAEHVTYVRNITDIEDKIMDAAKANGESIADLTQRTTKFYHDDMGALNAMRPTYEPRATEFVPQMIAIMEALVAKGFAYAAEGHVLFNVSAMPDYGQLSRRSLDDMIAGARVEVAPYKKHPADFVLWKPSTADQPGWDSPWGRGRPGWHIECSAMIRAHLGETIDIHGGGLDLIFPHHENEVAQSRCAHRGIPLARHWVHNGFVDMGAEEMSKSLGNVITVDQLLAAGHRGEVLRLALLSAHYRQPLPWTEQLIAQSKATLDRLFRAAGDAEAGAIDAGVIDALNDDLNTPLALSRMSAAFSRRSVVASMPGERGLVPASMM